MSNARRFSSYKVLGAVPIVFTVVFGDVSASLVVESLVLLVAIIGLQIHALEEKIC